MKRKELLSCVLVFALLSSIFAACAKKDDKPVATAPTSGTGGSIQKDVVNVGISADIGDFNPWSNTGAGPTQALWGLYQGLGHNVNNTYYPAVMSKYTVADDGLSMACEIFDYIHDWEGNPIMADDILFSYRKAEEMSPGLGLGNLVKDLVKTGTYTFTFEFYHPMYVGEFDTLIRQWYVVSQKTYEASTDQMHAHPVGTGPYKMTKYTSGYMFTYEKVEDFWQTDKSLIHPRDGSNVNTINYYILTESLQRTVALEQGLIDMCGTISGDDLAKFDGKNGFKLYGVPDDLSGTLFPNCDVSSPCSDINLRLAICYAISNQAILESIYGGVGAVNYELSPTWAVGYNMAWNNEDNYFHYNPETATKYLSKSSYNGQTLKIFCTTDEETVGTAQLVQNFLAQIGIKTTINAYEGTVFRQYVQDRSLWDIQIDKSATNLYYIQAVNGDFTKSKWPWGGSVNFIFNDELQDLLKLCMTAQTSTAENLEILHQYVIGNAYGMTMVNPIMNNVVRDGVKELALSFKKTIIPGGCIYTE